MARWVQDHPYQTVMYGFLFFLFFVVNDIWHRVARWNMKRKIQSLSGPLIPQSFPYAAPLQQRRRYTERDLYNLDPYQFEQLVARMFEGLGYHATVTPQAKDGGKDVVLHKDGQMIYVECKQWRKTVGVEIVRAAHSVVHTDRADFGFVVTSQTVSADAREYGRRVQPRIYCIDGPHLVSLLNQETGARLFA